MTSGRLIRKAFVTLIFITALLFSGCGNNVTSDSEDIRFPGEFEPMQAVTIAWPLDLPVDMVAKLTENVDVYVIIDPNNSSDSPEDVEKYLSEEGIDTKRIKCYEHELVSPYLRDYGAFFVFRGKDPQVVNFDNSIEWDDMVLDDEDGQPADDMTAGETFGVDFAEHLGISSVMSTIHMDGGNLMSDGRGTAVSDLMVTRTNDNDTAKVRDELRRVMGIDNYMLTTDPQGGFIEHVDCWGKFLAPDKVLVAKVPKDHPRYRDYEDAAAMFRSTLCCWGYPYRVYRVEEPLDGKTPDDSAAYPFTNSLILNKCVYLPLSDDDLYNEKAIRVYEEALPGYAVYGFKSDGSFLDWYNTDALHCRTHEIPDFDMVFVDHYNVIHGDVDPREEYPIEARIEAYSGKKIKEGSAKIRYRVDGSEWTEAPMVSDSEQGIYKGNIPAGDELASEGKHRIEYYVVAEDEAGNKGVQPYTGADDPHAFTISQQNIEQ